ncbi:DUF6541 family protein [Devriesea agamarum]|uniref:DUF6541 family protein n=1 Tax=Devriesea agamarum TaxID=472569 RepID=UPI00071C517D|nr:DUF6541 family protein [Devriesea agamarum]
MNDILVLAYAAAGIFFLAFVPPLPALRLLGIPWYLAVAVAPAASLGLAGFSAIIAAFIGVPWGLVPFFALALVAALSAALLSAGGFVVRGLPERSPVHVLCGRPGPAKQLIGPGICLAFSIAVVLIPIAIGFGSPTAILQRWDTIFHLVALRWIHEGADGSALHLGEIASSAHVPSFYPAGFHDLTSLVPGVPLPILLNASVSVLLLVPWTVGLTVLAHLAWPKVRYAGTVAALAAVLAPSAPLSEWVHLSPIPNLAAFSALPGVLAFALLCWRRVLSAPGAQWRELVGIVILSALFLSSLAIAHPISAVAALFFAGVGTAVSWWPGRRQRPLAGLVPLIAFTPIVILMATPLANRVTGFQGGLKVSLPQSLGEVASGLYTVWPMVLGPVFMLVALPALVASCAGRAPRWLAAWWIVMAALYIDASVDSPLGLSALFYRGQDRISVLLTAVLVILMPGGLAWWARRVSVWSTRLSARASARSGTGDVAIRVPKLVGIACAVLCALATLATIPVRLDNTAKNADLSYPDRPRFVREAELEAFTRYGPEMNHEGVVLASPFSGAPYLYILFGQQVHFPVAGTQVTEEDAALLRDAEEADTSPRKCLALRRQGIRYIYQDNLPYQHDRRYDALKHVPPSIGRVVFTTPHSRMLEVICDV